MADISNLLRKSINIYFSLDRMRYNWNERMRITKERADIEMEIADRINERDEYLHPTNIMGGKRSVSSKMLTYSFSNLPSHPYQIDGETAYSPSAIEALELLEKFIKAIEVNAGHGIAYTVNRRVFKKGLIRRDTNESTKSEFFHRTDGKMPRWTFLVPLESGNIEVDRRLFAKPMDSFAYHRNSHDINSSWIGEYSTPVYKGKEEDGMFSIAFSKNALSLMKSI